MKLRLYCRAVSVSFLLTAFCLQSKVLQAQDVRPSVRVGGVACTCGDRSTPSPAPAPAPSPMPESSHQARPTVENIPKVMPVAGPAPIARDSLPEAAPENPTPPPTPVPGPTPEPPQVSLPPAESSESIPPAGEHDPKEKYIAPQSQRLDVCFESMDAAAVAWYSFHYLDIKELQAKKQGELGAIVIPCEDKYAILYPYTPLKSLENQVSPVTSPLGGDWWESFVRDWSAEPNKIRYWTLTSVGFLHSHPIADDFSEGDLKTACVDNVVTYVMGPKLEIKRVAPPYYNWVTRRVSVQAWQTWNNTWGQVRSMTIDDACIEWAKGKAGSILPNPVTIERFEY